MSTFSKLNKHISSMAPVIAIVLVLVSLLLSVTSFTSVSKNDLIKLSPLFALISSMDNEKEVQVEKLELQFKKISAMINELNATTPPVKNVMGARLAEVELRVTHLEKQINLLNSAISDSPEKALSLPLMRRDIESLKAQYVSAIQHVESQVNRAYDLFKWIIGTLFLSVLSLAFGLYSKNQSESV